MVGFSFGCAHYDADLPADAEAGSVESATEEESGEEDAVATAEQPWWVDRAGVGTSGHEGILSLAILQANGTWGTQFPLLFGQTCLGTPANRMLAGNCATDIPDATIRTFYGIGADEDWHNAPLVQRIHWLRNYTNTGGVVSAWRGCHDARAAVIDATKMAISRWNARATDEAYYYLGHATHILQDSFAPAHTRRGIADGKSTLTDVCSYGRQAAGVCLHPATLASGDSTDQNVPEATAATNATTGYLREVWSLMLQPGACANWRSDACETAVRNVLEPYFDSTNPNDALVGQHRCDRLSGAPQVAWSVVGRPTDAKQIAACGGSTIYALNRNSAVYKSTTGLDNSWSYVTYVPNNASRIVCSGSILYALDSGSTLLAWDTTTLSWVPKYQLPSGIHQLANSLAGVPNMPTYGVSGENTIYLANTPGGTFALVGNFPGIVKSLAVVRIPDPWRTNLWSVPALVLGADAALYMSTGNGRTGTWRRVATLPDTVEIAGGGPGQRIWALNKDGTLHSGQFFY